MTATIGSNSQTLTVARIDGERIDARQDVVAVEEPLEIQLSAEREDGAAAKSLSVTMRTPGNDIELALGFLYTEAIIAARNAVRHAAHYGRIDPETGLQNIVRIELEANVEIDMDRLQRHFYTTSSCGVCGKASLDALRVGAPASLKNKGTTYNRNLILELPDKLLAKQRVFTKTGGLHAAAVFDSRGEIRLVREDVGRHNAVDKVVGALLTDDELPATAYGLLVSGRASFELMQKALVAGIPTLVAVGAPSSLAVRLATEFGMTLAGFLRDGHFNVYAGKERIS